jgi:AraC family transcriptional regulator, regulatory protein of adaptative response / DNA-3-methyladenine glycosylase II
MIAMDINHLGTVLNHEQCYRVVQSRDARFDGVIYIAVRTTRIYCRPGCSTPVLPKSKNVSFYRSAAAAQVAGYRACKRCRPDATPGSPLWNIRGDITARALRLITDGFLNRATVGELASELAVSERHLNRTVTNELGAGPLALARAQRAQTARVLIETTDLVFGNIAFAAGFASIRQFNETVLEVFATSPTELRRKALRRRVDQHFRVDGIGSAGVSRASEISVRLPFRGPLDVSALFGFLEMRCLPGIDEMVVARTGEGQVGRMYRRSMLLPGGPCVAELTAHEGHVQATFHLASLGDLGVAIARCRALLDLDADPLAIDEALGADEILRPHIVAAPGRRSPGAVDPHELCVRAVLGQQVSVAAARTIASRMVERLGTPLPNAVGGVMRLFPPADVVAAQTPESIGIPLARARALIGLSAALADGTVKLGPGVDRIEAQRSLVGLAGIGPWTAAYIAMRALSDPDVLLATDLIVRQGAAMLGMPKDIKELTRYGDRWRPWGSYVTHHLWSIATAPTPATATQSVNQSATLPTAARSAS